MNLETLRRKTDHLLANYQHSVRVVKEEEINLKREEVHLSSLQEGLSLCQSVAKTVQERAHEQIAKIVSRCLETVFGEDSYEFKILFEEKRNKTEARLVFVRDGEEIDPLTASGGGVVDLASFALRLSCLLLSRPQKRRLLVLDEPFKHLSSGYQEVAKELLLSLSEETGVQFLIVTHSDFLKIGKVVELG